MANILWTIVGVLILLWVIGLVTSIGGAFIHALLVIALIVVAFNVLTKGRATL